jgi:hypothetical protein
MKFNSHLLFFGLMNIMQPTCVFLTVCGYIYNHDCIYQLLDYLLKKNETTIGVTARQRVMDDETRRETQAYPCWSSEFVHPDSISALSRLKDKLLWWMSPAPLQGYELEAGFLLNIAIFSALGALPCLPGPCQMLWWDHLCTRGKKSNEGPLDMYFRCLLYLCPTLAKQY